MRRRKRRKRTFSSSSRGRRCVRPPPRPRPRPGRGGRPSPLGAPPPPPSVGATCSSPSASRRSPGGSPDSMVRTRNACLDGQIGGSILLNPKKSFKLINIQPTNLPIQRCPLPCFPLALSPLFLARHIGEGIQRGPAAATCNITLHFCDLARSGTRGNVYIRICFPSSSQSTDTRRLLAAFSNSTNGNLVAETALKNAAFPLCAAVRPPVRRRSALAFSCGRADRRTDAVRVE